MAKRRARKSGRRPAEKNTPASGLVLFQPEDGGDALRVRIEGETVWLTQRQIAELFQVTVPTVNEHLRTIIAEGEIDPAPTIRKFRIVQTEGSREIARTVDHYSLEAILGVGYRVRSQRGTQFRQWATATLSEFLAKGFVLDDERLKEGRSLGKDYFDELLERIRDIRASERRFYQKITDIYATSIDYDSKAPITQDFYATVQNKLHWAIHGHTAAEIITERADASKPNMGLTTWKNAPRGPVRKGDIGVAKNYLTAEEISALNRIVTMYLDYAEDQARRQNPMHMADWVTKLDAFLQFNERNILTHAGSVSAEMAKEHAEREFAKHEAARRLEDASKPTSDFDKMIEQAKRLEAGGQPQKPKKKLGKKKNSAG